MADIYSLIDDLLDAPVGPRDVLNATLHWLASQPGVRASGDANDVWTYVLPAEGPGEADITVTVVEPELGVDPESLPCWLCTNQTDRSPDNPVMRNTTGATKVIDAADPTTAYQLTCGHWTI